MRKIASSLVFLATLVWDVLECQVVKRQNWWDEVDRHLFLGAFPTRSSVKRLRALGVCAVVNMCDEFAGPAKEYRQFGINELKIPTADFSEPSVDDIRRAIVYINQHRGAPGAVYIHCKSGRGRSATVVLCWIMQTYRISAEDAQLRLQQRRGQVLKNLFRRPCVQKVSEDNLNSTTSNTNPALSDSRAVR